MADLVRIVAVPLFVVVGSIVLRAERNRSQQVEWGEQDRLFGFDLILNAMVFLLLFWIDGSLAFSLLSHDLDRQTVQVYESIPPEQRDFDGRRVRPDTDGAIFYCSAELGGMLDVQPDMVGFSSSELEAVVVEADYNGGLLQASLCAELFELEEEVVAEARRADRSSYLFVTYLVLLWGMSSLVRRFGYDQSQSPSRVRYWQGVVPANAVGVVALLVVFLVAGGR